MVDSTTAPPSGAPAAVVTCRQLWRKGRDCHGRLGVAPQRDDVRGDERQRLVENALLAGRCAGLNQDSCQVGALRKAVE